MKKKAIEKIPYLTISGENKHKGAKYVGVTAFKNISKVRHLFLEVYRNKKGEREVPIVRIVLTKNDFGNYFPSENVWTSQKIETDYYYSGTALLWNTPEERKDTWQMEEKRSVLFDEKDLDRIKNMCTATAWNGMSWWKYIYRQEIEIRSEKNRKVAERKYERRQQALNDRELHTEVLPAQRILDWADKIQFREKHFLYYKKRGCWVQIACSRCGRVDERRWKAGISYESNFQKFVQEPREGEFGNCPLCNARGEWKCQGKVKGWHGITNHLFLGQKYKEKGMVVRYVEVSKIWKLGLTCGENGPEMGNASEKLTETEIARAYFEPDKSPQIDYHKCNPYTGEDFWDDCNLSGLANINIREAAIMPETFENIKGTIFQYSAIKEYAAENIREINLVDYMEAYRALPQIEILVKMKMIGVVRQLIQNQGAVAIWKNMNRPDEFLGIKKERVKQLAEKKGDMKFLRIMQMEKRMQQNWSMDVIEGLAEIGAERGKLEIALRYMSVKKLLNRISRYAKWEYGTGCITATARLKEMAGKYMDYIYMSQMLGYDLHNTVYQYPKNIEEKHRERVMESTQKEMDIRLKEVTEKFPLIRKHYRALRKQYIYEDENYIVRPARSAEEIVIEGQTLHHCVGGNNYLKKHNDGKSYILMLRKKNKPNIPYITIEIDAKTEAIIQWYGANDKKPDEGKMDKWIKSYVVRLRCEKKANKEKERLKIAI